MRRYLVVANQTLGGDHLLERLETAASEGECRIHVLVPASTDPTAWSYDNEADHTTAENRLERALDRFSSLGCEVTGEVGDHRPVDAVLDALRKGEFDEVIISTLPPGGSRWLRLDIVSRVRRAVDIPVSHVTAAAEQLTNG